jgi:hypothetical protein
MPSDQFSWNVTPKEAVQLQKQLRELVKLIPLAQPPTTRSMSTVSLIWPHRAKVLPFRGVRVY